MSGKDGMLILAFQSAAEFWLQPQKKELISFFSDVHNPPLRSTEDMNETYNQGGGGGSLEEEVCHLAAERRLSLPLHVMVFEPAQRKRNRNIVYHVNPKAYPKNCYTLLTHRIAVLNPEYCFLQAAQFLDLPELVLLACNLCAIYAVDQTSKFRQEKRTPVTNVKKIRKVLDTLKNAAGAHKAKVAIQFALDCSNSPAETKIAAEGMISFQYGGFALPKPQLNYDVTLSADGQELFGRASCYCDMVWPEAKGIVEYDGKESHMEEEQFHYDKRRTTALVLSGYKVINVTKDHLKNTKTIEDLFLLIRKTLKLRTRKERFDKYKEKRRETIWKIFFTSNRRKGGFPTCGF